jgi:hypothetical protein
MTAPEAWGRIYAVLDRLTKPKGLGPTTINNASQIPAHIFPPVHSAVRRDLAKDKAADRRLGELMECIDLGALSPQYTAAEQAEFFMGLQKERHNGDSPQTEIGGAD